MFELRLIDGRYRLEAIAIMCINLKGETGLYLGPSTLEGMITTFVLNAILHHVDMSWIICCNKAIE